jgi:hypothetical protein
MAAPILTLTDSNNTPLQVLNFGVVDAGNQTAGIPVHFWNNFSAAEGVSDALNPQITTKTYNGLDSGDSVFNGNEVVVNQMISAQCVSAGQTQYTSIGGPNVLGIADSPPPAGQSYTPIISGEGSYASCLLRASVPSSATAGSISFLLRITYQYS